MPLIKLTTKPALYPPEDGSEGTTLQERTAEFGEALPGLFVTNTTELRMEPGTLEKGVQVSHKLAHGRDVNVPDLWILIEFSEDGLTEVEQTEVTGNVKALLIGWFKNHGYLGLPESYVCDVRWSPSHGFLKLGGESFNW